jgi:hypothetical protein
MFRQSRQETDGAPRLGILDSDRGIDMPFIRFIVTGLHPESGVEDGLFGPAYSLRDNPDLGEAERSTLSETLTWFEKNLKTPARFNRTRSKGYYRRNTKAIAWFRDTASECISRMHVLKRVLESHGHPVTVVHETHVGYVVYEDEAQVVAEPFADTRTGPAR